MRLLVLTAVTGYGLSLSPLVMADQNIMPVGKGNLETRAAGPVLYSEDLLRFPGPEISDTVMFPVFIEPAGAPALDEGAVAFHLRRIETPDLGPYNAGTFFEQSASIPWDIAFILGGTIGGGIVSWNWGSAPFHFVDEGWFGKDTSYLGMDKVGHAYSTYLYAEYFTQRIAHSAEDVSGAAITGAVLAMGVQTSVEFFDGFSSTYGFSYEDLIMDGVGAGFSVLRSTVPGLADKLDFRMEYIPSGNGGGFGPTSDYSGQKYLLALKLGGFETVEDTPLRFLELQAGYFARGFTEEERANGDERRREPYVAIGFNLQELLDNGKVSETVPGLLAHRILEYVQVPYTYAATTQD